MIRQLARVAIPRQMSLATRAQRHFSIKAIYSTFPATLLYYSPRQNSSLFDVRELDSRPNRYVDDGVVVDKEGRVYPAADNNISVSNGAVMCPNTFLMQELIRRYYDENLDCEDEGQHVETPDILTVPKDLNQSLDEFFQKHAAMEEADAWLDKHPFQGAVADDADGTWMSK